MQFLGSSIFDYKANLVYIVHKASGGDSSPLNRTSNLNGQPFTGKAEGDSIRIEFVNVGNVTYSGFSPVTDDNSKNTEPIEESQLEDSGAGFSDLFGQVEISIPNPDGTFDEEKWEFAKLKQDETLPVGTHIKTSEKSGGIISFADMTTYHLKPGTELVFSSPCAKDCQIQILAGNLWTNVKKMMKDGSMEIEMSQAVAGIKGTRLVLSENGKESTIKVTEGTVKYTSKSTGAFVDVSAGESVTASSGGLSEKTTFDPIAEEKQWQEFDDSIKKAKTSIPNNRNIIYILGGIIITTAIIGFFLIKVRRHKK